MTATVVVNGATLDLETTSLPTLGYTVMMAFRDIEVTQPKMIDAMTAAGLEKFAPKAPTSKATLRLAVQKWVAGRVRGEAGQEIGKRVGIKVVNSSDNTILTYLVTIEQSDRKALSISLDTTMRIFLWKATDEIRVTLTSTGGTDADVQEEVALTRELGAIWSGLRGTLASKQVRELLCDLCVAESGVRMYPGAAVFFLPESKRATVMGLRALGRALREDNQGITMHVYPHINDQLAREEVGDTARLALLSEIENLGEQIDKSAEREKGARAGTITKRLAEVDALRVKVAEYGDLLGNSFRDERFDTELDSLAARAGAITTADQLRAEREEEQPEQLVIPVVLGDESREDREL